MDIIVNKLRGSVMLCVIVMVIVFCCQCTAISTEERLDNLELKVSGLDFSTQKKYMELKRKISNFNVLGGNNDTQGTDISTVNKRLKSYDVKVDAFVDEQRQRTDVIARAISEEKIITREIITLVNDLSESNAESVMEIEDNLQDSENERAQFKTDWKAFQDEIRLEIKTLNDKVESLQNTLSDFDGNVVLHVGKKVTPCDDGWVLKNGICYLYSENKLSWFGANIVCSDYGGKLAEPDTESKYTVVLGIMKLGLDIWIGGSDIERKREWMWEYSQSPVEMDRWEPGQPNNLNGNQFCLEIGFHGRLNDENCQVENYYICEKPSNA